MRDFGSVDGAIWLDDPDDVALQRTYGPWARMAPAGVADLLAPFHRPWWIVGGWAVEAFTGVPREHRDVDVAFFRSDLPALHESLGADYDLWTVGSGMLRVLDAANPDFHPDANQVWVREHAWAPWLLDLVGSPGDETRWIHRKDPTVEAPLAEVSWTAPDGIRYLAPDLTLSFKALSGRPRDDADFAAALPRLSVAERARLAAFLRRNAAGHRWLDQLG